MTINCLSSAPPTGWRTFVVSFAGACRAVTLSASSPRRRRPTYREPPPVNPLCERFMHRMWLGYAVLYGPRAARRRFGFLNFRDSTLLLPALFDRCVVSICRRSKYCQVSRVLLAWIERCVSWTEQESKVYYQQALHCWKRLLKETIYTRVTVKMWKLKFEELR